MFAAFMNFNSFIFPKIAKIIYWIGLILIVLGTLTGVVAALAISGENGGGGIIGAVGILVGGAVGIVVWRIMVELWIVLFSILEVLKDIRDQR